MGRQAAALDYRVDRRGLVFDSVQYASFLVVQPQFDGMTNHAAFAGGSGFDQGAEFIEDVFHAFDQLGAIPYQTMTSARTTLVDPAGYGEYVAALLAGVPGGNHGARIPRRLPRQAIRRSAR